MAHVEELVGWTGVGRCFRRTRAVRIGDADPAGRLRLDALTRYLQDVSTDDTDEVGMSDGTWVVRRTVVRVEVAPAYGEVLTMSTFCAGLGARWAERRIDVRGGRGASLGASTIWIHVDPATGRPARLPPRFTATYAEAAQGRVVTPRLHLPDPPSEAERRAWPLRATDVDVLGHVNNAACWEVVEEELAARPDLRGGPTTAVVEFHGAVPAEATLDRLVVHEPRAVALWLVPRGGHEVLLSARVDALG